MIHQLQHCRLRLVEQDHLGDLLLQNGHLRLSLDLLCQNQVRQSPLMNHSGQPPLIMGGTLLTSLPLSRSPEVRQGLPVVYSVIKAPDGAHQVRILPDQRPPVTLSQERGATQASSSARTLLRTLIIDTEIRST